MDYENVEFAYRSTVSNVVSAVADGDFARLYTALAKTDERLRNNLVIFLTRNPLPGWQKAISYLTDGLDAFSSVRAAAVCLLLMNMKERV